MSLKWLEVAKRLQAIAQNGLTFTEGEYDRERYEELRDISVKMMSHYSGEEMQKVGELFAFEKGYQTPKTDVRGVVFKERKILMVKEAADGKWSLPGGWADINYSPREVAEKEVWEEAGLEVKSGRLLAVFDKHKHPHPPDPYHAYKLFIRCEIIGGELKTSIETLDVGFFGKEDLPPLSEERNTHSQILTMFDYLENPEKEVLLD
ncbi:NUDIX hydrolase [Rapidithrix thailandica]|uniref:NUDIX hydrolase n=1 Tax=Rapidithrix thailandica TaxID=413964 RepID=A0AAW9RXB7_9BACT